jgi:adenosine 3'-phospho 5'-phosphosulfate transporter B3
LGSALGFAALQEGVFRIPGFKFSAWMTVLTTFTYFLCGALEMKLTNDSRKGSWKNYGILSIYTYGGMAMTNYALSYLNYATRIVFKSAKIIPVMAFSVLIVGKKYNWKEWLSAAILVAGIVLFTLGDVASSPAFAPIGVLLIAGALCVDAICANFEEKNFFRCETPSTTQEVLCYASLIGTAYGLVPLIASGGLAPALAFSQANPQVVPMIMAFSVMGYSSVSFILSLIKYFPSCSSPRNSTGSTSRVSWPCWFPRSTPSTSRTRRTRPRLRPRLPAALKRCPYNWFAINSRSRGLIERTNED